MSSREYSTELKPETRMRHLVMLAAVLALLLGVLSLFSIPLDIAPRRILLLAWLSVGGAQTLHIAWSHKKIARIRLFCDGEVTLYDRAGGLQSARLASGSVVLARLAWLRLQPAEGRCRYELLRGDGRENQQWRRLQVIWRQLGPVT